MRLSGTQDASVSCAAFKSFVEAAQPVAAKRVVMTQSLGNMVACEALRQGLNVGKYFMFNAAVPSEAIDGTLQDAGAATRAKYVPSDWDGYDPRSWASQRRGEESLVGRDVLESALPQPIDSSASLRLRYLRVRRKQFHGHASLAST